MATLYSLLFFSCIIPFFLLLMHAWFKEEKPSPGLFLLLLPALLFLVMVVKEMIRLW